MNRLYADIYHDNIPCRGAGAVQVAGGGSADPMSSEGRRPHQGGAAARSRQLQASDQEGGQGVRRWQQLPQSRHVRTSSLYSPMLFMQL